MKTFSSILNGTAIALFCGVAVANHNGSNQTGTDQLVDTRLDFAANGLVSAANQLVQALLSCHGESHIVMDAESLAVAAEHFRDKVELGPEDLDIDYESVTEAFLEVTRRLLSSDEIRFNRNARSAYFKVSGANLRLRQAWLGHCDSDNRGGEIGIGGIGRRIGDDDELLDDDDSGLLIDDDLRLNGNDRGWIPVGRGPRRGDGRG